MKKIAVIGSGISGLSAAYHLKKNNLSFTIFEKSSRIGGHAHPIYLKDEWIDTAFLIFNLETYPKFCNFLKENNLESSIIDVEMSSCFMHEKINYLLGGKLSQVFLDFKNLVNPRFYKLFVEISLFRKRSLAFLKKPNHNVTIKEYLSSYSKTLKDNFIFPLCCSIWSLPPSDFEKFPATSVLQYFYNHGILQGSSKRQWKTLKGSSHVYLQVFEKIFKNELKVDQPVKKISRKGNSVDVHLMDRVETFDYVILATHADESLRLIDSPSEEERGILSKITYKKTKSFLHQDHNFLFSSKRGHASWNTRWSDNKLSITYYLNKIQKLKQEQKVLVTLSDHERPDNIIQEFDLRHPCQTLESKIALESVRKIQKAPVFFCGAWDGHGFHEDGFASGENSVKLLLSDLALAGNN